MRVLVISATFPPMQSGGANYAFHFCQHLAARGAEVHVVTSRIEGIKTDPSLRVYALMDDWSWREAPRLLRLARRLRPDVINLHFIGVIYRNHPMITFALTFIKHLLPRTRVVTLIEYPEGINLRLDSRLKDAVYRAVARLVGPKGVSQGYGTILRDSDRIIILSGAHSHELSKHLAGVAEKCILIPPPPLMRMSEEAGGGARARGRASLGVAPGEFLLIYYGYLYPQKGIETLLQAFKLVARSATHLRLAVVGGSNEVILRASQRPLYVEELRGMAEQLGIADKVIWTGYCPSDTEQASLYFRGADACVLPFEAGVYLNNSTFSAAAAHGLPIITTRPEVVEPLYKDRENVYLCPPKVPEALADAIESVVTDAELRRRLSAGSLELAREWLSWDRAMDRTMEAFGTTGGRI